ncbi:hypothetical protein [Limimaricola pyoseonensis]|uniref:Uncharacterized protein n=1 Tax=Limimaricola pyoseonensis TaxID=521013 RepID=A0A1G7EVZ9_9RHOB|nr:hypothetical protein [Limimaricola pyoseonensis]SDE67595.1 hypothetical protein SAMN04488567_2308 [Limimaricola pyoseonensis]
MTTIKTTFAAIAAATIGTSALAMTEVNGFGNQNYIPERSYVNLDLVRSATGGSVEILDYRGSVAGAVLGEAMVNAGANSDVRIQLDREPFSDVIAVLYDAEGNAVAERRLFLND